MLLLVAEQEAILYLRGVLISTTAYRFASFILKCNLHFFLLFTGKVMERSHYCFPLRETATMAQNGQSRFMSFLICQSWHEEMTNAGRAFKLSFEFANYLHIPIANSGTVIDAAFEIHIFWHLSVCHTVILAMDKSTRGNVARPWPITFDFEEKNK